MERPARRPVHRQHMYMSCLLTQSRALQHASRLTCVAQVAEGLSDLERCSVFLEQQEPIQVQQAFQSLPELTSQYGKAALTTVSAALKRAIATASAECSSTLAGAFRDILQRRLLLPRDALDELSPLILQQVKLAAKDDPDVREAWLQALNALVPCLDKATAIRHVLAYGLQHSAAAVGETVDARVLGCRMLAVAVQALPPDEARPSSCDPLSRLQSAGVLAAMPQSCAVCRCWPRCCRTFGRCARTCRRTCGEPSASMCSCRLRQRWAQTRSLSTCWTSCWSWSMCARLRCAIRACCLAERA